MYELSTFSKSIYIFFYIYTFGKMYNIIHSYIDFIKKIKKNIKNIKKTIDKQKNRYYNILVNKERTISPKGSKND